MTPRTKDDYARRIDEEMNRLLPDSLWTARQKLVLACRMLAANGHWRGLAGQITARDPEGKGYWTLAFGMGFGEAGIGDILMVDDDLHTIEGSGMANPATRFHLWVYRHRPEVNCIVHTHPPAVSALSMIDQPLTVAHMDQTPFFGDCAHLREWPGLPIADREGEIIAGALGDKRAIILAHHGLLTVGRSIEEAAVMAVWLEQAADLHLRARSAGTIVPVPEELAQESHDFLVKPKILGLTFASFARPVLRDDPTCID